MSKADEIRQAILLSAVCGQLTKQLDCDTPVFQTLLDISEKKRCLTKEKLISKDKKIRGGLREKYPLGIPDSWQVVDLQSVSTVITDGEHKTPRRVQNYKGYYLLSARNVTNKGISLTDVDYVDDAEFEYLSKRCNPQKGDILISCSGSVGRTCVVKDNNKYVMVRSAAMVRCLNVSSDYICIAIRSPYVQQQIDELKKQSVQANLFQAAIASLQIPLPPIEEQQRIVDRVNELLAKVDEFEKIENRLTAVKEKFPSDLRAAILQAAMQGKLTEQLDTDSSVDDLLEEIKPSEHTSSGKGRRKSKSLNIEFFDIPETWRWVKLSECGTTNIGLTYSPSDVSITDGTIVLRSSNIQNGAMDYNDIVRVNMTIPENKMCHIGDILICARNGSKRLVGKSAIIDKEGMAFGTFMAIYRSKCNSYINYVLESPHFRKSVLGGAETTTINQVTQDMLENYMFPLPPIEEQQRIVERLDALLPLCDELTEE